MKLAGTRTEPPVSVPIASVVSPVATTTPEPDEEPPGARARVVAADRGIAAVQFPEPQAVIGMLGRRELALDRAQLSIAIEHELDRLGVRGQQFLGDMRQRQIRRHVETAGLGLNLTAHQRQQTRLAAAVLAGDADLLAAKQAEAGAGEQRAFAATDTEVGEVEHKRARSL